MQSGMDPGAVRVVLRLSEFVSGVPITAQAMPDGPQHGCRQRWWLLEIEAANERIDWVVDWVGHCKLLKCASYVVTQNRIMQRCGRGDKHPAACSARR